MANYRSNRPSPSVSATLFKVGTIKIGNDGNNYIIKQASNGVQRWVKLTQNTSSSGLKKSKTQQITKKLMPKKTVAKKKVISKKQNNNSVIKKKLPTCFD